MKKIINYEKDIIFKTNIGEICSISLEHDFTVDDGKLLGDFIVSGEYKTNELSLNKENFNFRLPLEYELENNVDVSSLSYDIENFEYNTKDDELNVYIDFGIRYDERNIEPIIPHVDEDFLNQEDIEFVIDEDIFEKDIELSKPKEKNEDERKMTDTEKNIVLDETLEEDAYMTYHVHIVREGDTLENIAIKYNSTIDMIKEYNNTEIIELKSKLIVPEISNE